MERVGQGGWDWWRNARNEIDGRGRGARVATWEVSGAPLPSFYFINSFVS